MGSKNVLDGGKFDKLTLPQDPPAKNFLAMNVYDTPTHPLLPIDNPHPSVMSLSDAVANEYERRACDRPGARPGIRGPRVARTPRRSLRHRTERQLVGQPSCGSVSRPSQGCGREGIPNGVYRLR